MNKLWKKTTAHSQNILNVDVLYNIKRKKYKTVCAEVWQDRGSYPQYIALEASTLTITLLMRFPIFIYFLLICLIKISYCPSIYYLKTKINPKE
jgi:fumarate reductase subunit C